MLAVSACSCIVRGQTAEASAPAHTKFTVHSSCRVGDRVASTEQVQLCARRGQQGSAGNLVKLVACMHCCMERPLTRVTACASTVSPGRLAVVRLHAAGSLR